ncbi:putative acyl carrier protein 2, mitochondrial-like [Capsicum annuum]|nr:putative acyl carrier protein 2, mitochondrial-like [Capsicum annuum]
MSHNVMLSLYLGISDFMSARQVFDEIGERNVACWKAMTNGRVMASYLMNEIKNITREYFHQPLTEKNKIKLSAETGYWGYQKIRENITKGIPDIPEAIDCYREVKHGMYGDLGAVMQGSNKWPSYPPNLSRKILREIALALGGSADEMEGEISGDPFWVLRIIGYPAASISNGHDRTQNDVRWFLLYLIMVDASYIWSEIYLETYVGLLEPNFDAAIEPLDVCLQKTGGTKNFEGAVYGKHLKMFKKPKKIFAYTVEHNVL